MDAGLAVVLLVVLSPLLLLLALLVAATSPGGALFAQVRVGRAGVPFRMLKFRTMRLGAAGAQVTAQGDARVTAVGRVLRATKLDELPELWNIVRGDMAFVGPRPEVPRYVDLQQPSWQRVLRVRPGLTDETTLLLRDEEAVLALLGGDPEARYVDTLLPWKLEHSAAALETRSAAGDLLLLGRTLLRIVLPRRSSAELASEIRASCGDVGARERS